MGSVAQVLINAVTAEVDLGEGNFTGFPTNQELAFTPRNLPLRGGHLLGVSGVQFK
jgi:hypothetical protein